VYRVVSKSSDTTSSVGPVVFGLLLIAVVAVTSAASATASSPRVVPTRAQAVRWPAPAPDRVVALTEAAGLTLEKQESLQHHVHSHLDMYVDGRRVVVPAGIGINIADPGVKHFPIDGHMVHGRIDECNDPCISPLHTHDVSGILHTESATAVDNTLGQFFTEWNVTLTADCVDTYCTPDERIAVYVNGRKQPFADAADIALTDHKEIALVIGRPPSRIPKTADFSQA
jgi:hypothetical protein